VALLATLSPRPTAAAVGDVVAYDAVDAFELRSGNNIRVSGVISGEGASSTTDYNLLSGSTTTDYAARCDRFALLAMSQPGKFQFALVRSGS
jgi:hypothetical protein